jgi:hypothetical protein
MCECGWDSADRRHVPVSICNERADCCDHIRAGCDCQLFQSLRHPCAVFRCCRGPSRSAGHMLRCSHTISRNITLSPSLSVCVRPWRSWRSHGWKFERKTVKWGELGWLSVHSDQAAGCGTNWLGFDSRKCRRKRLSLSQASAAEQMTTKCQICLCPGFGAHWVLREYKGRGREACQG